MNYDDFLKKYETEARIKRSNAISVEVESYLSFKTGTMMEFGCTTGLIGFQLKNKVNELFLVDSSKEMIELVNHKIEKKSGMNITALHEEMLYADFHKEFDVIYVPLSLHHNKDVQNIVNILVDFLKKNGKFIVIDLLNDKRNLQKNGEKFEENIGFSIEEITQILENSGLVEVIGRKFYSSYKRTNESSQPYSLFSIIGQKP